MSALNGDKARFQRQRKATLLRRERSRLALAGLRLALRPLPDSDEPGSADIRGGTTRLIRGGR